MKTLRELAVDLASGAVTASQLVGECLEAITDPTGEGGRAFLLVAADRARATALVFRLAREERDAWVNWPARVAAVMAAELKIEAHALQKQLESQVRAQLRDLAQVAPDFQ